MNNENTTPEDFINVWRVDDELLTVVLTQVYQDTPIMCWIPVMYGNGCYAYFVTEKDARDTLTAVLKHKIAELQAILEGNK